MSFEEPVAYHSLKEAVQLYFTPTPPSHGGLVALADVDGDGRAELVMGTTRGWLTVFKGGRGIAENTLYNQGPWAHCRIDALDTLSMFTVGSFMPDDGVEEDEEDDGGDSSGGADAPTAPAEGLGAVDIGKRTAAALESKGSSPGRGGGGHRGGGGSARNRCACRWRRGGACCCSAAKSSTRRACLRGW
jgi:hypothetical protein